MQSAEVTNEEGKASCDIWVLGNKYGLNALDASIREGVVRSVTFKAYSYWITKCNLGLIFNVDVDGDNFLNLGEYQGGVGLKYFISQKVACRGLCNFEYVSSSHSTSLTLGNSLEYHFLNGRISPYVGGVLNIGFVSTKGEIDSENWTKSLVVLFTIGPLVGLRWLYWIFFLFSWNTSW